MARLPTLSRGRNWLSRYLPSTPMPRMRPFDEMGVSSMPVYGGYIVSVERNPEWIGAWKYKTASDIATNVSIVAAGVHYFLNLVARPTWKVVPVSDKDKKALDYAEFVDDVINTMITPWSRVVRRAAMYHFYGFAIQEWTAMKRDDGKIGYKDIETRSQYTIEQWSVSDRGSVEGVWQRSPQTDALLPIPRNKTLYLVEDTLSDSPEGVGVFRHMAEPWNRLKKFLELETMAFERDLRGTPIGRAPLTAIRDAISAGKITQQDGNSLIEGMKQFVQMQVKSQNTGMLLDSAPYTSMGANGPQVAGNYQWGMELLQGSAIGLQELRQAIDRLQREMARIIGVEGLMLGDSPAGSRALSEDKSKALYLVANSVLNNMAAQATKDLIDPLWILNGFEEELKPWFQPEDVTFKDVDQISAVLRDLASAGAILDPLDPVVDDMRDLLGVSRPNREESDMDAAGMQERPGVEAGPPGAAGSKTPLNGEKPNGKTKPKATLEVEISAKKYSDGHFGKAEAFDPGQGFERFGPQEPTDWVETGWPGTDATGRATDYRASGSGEAGLEKYDPNQPRYPKGHPLGGQWQALNALEQAGRVPQPGEEDVPSAQDLLARFDFPESERFEAGLPSEVRDKIAWAESELAKTIATTRKASEGGFMNEDGKTWTPEREVLHEQILSEFFSAEAVARATPEDGQAPEAILLGGRGGAGKSTALKSGTFIGLDTNEYLTVNADELMTHLPGFQGHLAGAYNAEGQYLAEKAEHLARNAGLNVIYDATLKSTQPAVDRVQMYKNAGYNVASYFVHVAPEESARRSMVQRFMHPGGRYVPSKILLANLTNEQSFDTIRPMVDKWALFDGNRNPPRLVGRGEKR
jgi:predicted ABC-type ATPase